MARHAVLLWIFLMIQGIQGIQAMLPALSWASPPIRTTQKTIVIDPGHGGMDPGIPLARGLTEKQVVLDLAKQMARLLDSQYNVLLTRNTDTSLPAAKRAAYANRNRADFFLSLHLHQRKSDQGTVFYSQGPAGERTETPGSWKDQPLTFQAESRKAASILAREIQAGPGIPFSVIPAPACVLEGTLMPAVVVELFSISMLTGTANMETVLTRFAESICRGLDLYFKALDQNPGK